MIAYNYTDFPVSDIQTNLRTKNTMEFSMWCLLHIVFFRFLYNSIMSVKIFITQNIQLKNTVIYVIYNSIFTATVKHIVFFKTYKQYTSDRSINYRKRF